MFIVKLLVFWTVLFGPLAGPPEPATPKPVPVLMYHAMGNRGGRYSMTPRDFERQLEDMRRAGFFLINLSELLRGDFSRVPAGKRPVVITFDDSEIGQFRVLPDGRIDPLCAVGILEKFKREHPEFGSGATFFIFARDERGSSIFFQPERLGLVEAFCERYYLCAKGRGWGRPRLWQAKLRWLVANGYEVGNHTVTHADLGKLDPAGIAREIGVCQRLLEEAVGETRVKTRGLNPLPLWGLSYPFGSVPLGAAEYMLCREGDFGGRHYRFDYAVAAWGGMCPHPGTEEFAAVKWRIPRVEMHAVRGGGGLDSRWLTLYADCYVKGADEGDWPFRDLLTASLKSIAAGPGTWFSPGPDLGLEQGWTARRLDELAAGFQRPIKRLPPPPAYF